uniref:DNA-damage-inducible protein J n=1 Tax=Candidatus Kentrum sp. TUN TaxID=2126343 RepID=A0A450Z8Y5_9GAMM|nr:MAG: DNA-damage-inducible protein J [Candidatus Kentron sp. TUN]VFK50778.1 MAG: DNA-damage-inducible protein J [Candidatus Kentron sp. TUN]VFK51303.1 MAG: DNA-damage-inducible protein J [Candidatus Kentron sp. TUN]
MPNIYRMGLDTTQAVMMFYKQVKFRGGLSFDIVVSILTTKWPFEFSEAECGLIVYENADDLFRNLGI